MRSCRWRLRGRIGRRSFAHTLSQKPLLPARIPETTFRSSECAGLLLLPVKQTAARMGMAGSGPIDLRAVPAGSRHPETRFPKSPLPLPPSLRLFLEIDADPHYLPYMSPVALVLANPALQPFFGVEPRLLESSRGRTWKKRLRFMLQPLLQKRRLSMGERSWCPRPS